MKKVFSIGLVVVFALCLLVVICNAISGSISAPSGSGKNSASGNSQASQNDSVPDPVVDKILVGKDGKPVHYRREESHGFAADLATAGDAAAKTGGKVNVDVHLYGNSVAKSQKVSPNFESREAMAARSQWECAKIDYGFKHRARITAESDYGKHSYTANDDREKESRAEDAMIAFKAEYVKLLQEEGFTADEIKNKVGVH